MLRIAVVEDNAEMRGQIHDFLLRYREENRIDLQVTLFRDGAEILDRYRPIYDIIFMDIEMPGVNGMDAAEQIRAWDSEVVLVFITNLAQYAIRGYSVRALDYVLKPINYFTFSTKLEKAAQMVQRRASGQVVLRLSDGAVRLETRQIRYVEVQNGVLRYHTELGDFDVRGTLQAAEAELAPYHFVRCNYWYLVNLMYVSKVKKDVAVVDGVELQISRRNKNAFMAALTDYVGGGG